jgi:TonB family protein
VFFSFLTLAFAAATPLPASAKPAIPSLQGLFLGDDYPAVALDRNEQGAVGVMVTVSPAGSVADCIVETSSGSAALDVQTCRIVWLRAKFKPSKDGPWTLHQTIRWAIAGDSGAPSEAWSARVIITVADGKPPRCWSIGDGILEKAPPPVTSCSADMLSAAKQLPTVPAHAVDFVQETAFAVGSEPSLHMVDGDRLVGRQVAEVDVDASGARTACRIIETAGETPPNFKGACATVATGYIAKKGADGKTIPFTGRYVMGAYYHTGSAN